MTYRAEPRFQHDAIPRVGVLLVNLGTPDAATPAAVRRYLAEFLADPRVVEIPRVAWRPLLHGVVLRTRPAKSAQRYAAIWTKDGSPLAIHTNKQRVLLAGYLGQRLKSLGLPADHVMVEHGMRYGNPPLGAALRSRGGRTRIPRGTCARRPLWVRLACRGSRAARRAAAARHGRDRGCR